MLPSVGQQLLGRPLPASFRALAPPMVLAALWPILIERVAPVAPARSRMALDVATVALLAAVFCFGAPGRGEQASALRHPLLRVDGAPRGRPVATRRPGRPRASRAAPSPPRPRDHPGWPRAQRPLRRDRERPRHRRVQRPWVRAGATTPFTNARSCRSASASRRCARSTRPRPSRSRCSGAVSRRRPRARRCTSGAAALEYAHAAGFDTAYWTSQNLFFANAGTLARGAAAFALGERDRPGPQPHLRDRRRRRKARGRRAARPPFDGRGAFAVPCGVVHLSNTHFPYFIDEADAPFQPQSTAYGAGDAPAVRNRYRDAIHRQDALVARLVRGLRALPGGERVAIAFISDHGEQISAERGAVGHTWSVYDEEVRVPFWIGRACGGARAGAGSAASCAAGPARDPARRAPDAPRSHGRVGCAADRVAARVDARREPAARRPGARPDRAHQLQQHLRLRVQELGRHVAHEEDRRHRERRELAMLRPSPATPLERRDLGAAACGNLQAVAEGEGRGTPFWSCPPGQARSPAPRPCAGAMVAGEWTKEATRGLKSPDRNERDTPRKRAPRDVRCPMLSTRPETRVR